MVKIDERNTSQIIAPNVQDALNGLFGKRCCRLRAGEHRSLSLGFGEKIPHSRKRSVDSFKGEWEVGTYTAAWRIIRDGEIISGSMTPAESNDDMERQVEGIHLGSVQSIEMLSRFDIRLVLDGGMSIDFIGVSSDDDEMFHVFGPNHLLVKYYCAGKWSIGQSNIPG